MTAANKSELHRSEPDAPLLDRLANPPHRYSPAEMRNEAFQRIVVLEEALECMLGAFDKPIARRKIDSAFANECRRIARNALGK